MIHPDLGGHLLLCVARILEIPLQRAQQLIRTNNIFFWQSTPPLRAVTAKYTSLETTMKRAPDNLAGKERDATLLNFCQTVGRYRGHI
jgi:hypothetical protein